MAPPEHASLALALKGRGTACVAAGLACLLVVSTAAANGRFPRAQRLIQDRVNPDLMALYGTYGLLVTRDAGVSWRHVCEAATGPYAGEDPLLEIMANERVVLRTDSGLVKSDPSLCGYAPVLGSESQALQDITRDSATSDGLLALSTTLGADGVFTSSLSVSTDGGDTFAPFASVAPDILELGLTLDVAPSRPELIYLSGFDELGRGKLVRSNDRGASFAGFEISGLGVAAPPYIAAVSALNPERVFVRTDEFQRADDFEARETANDSLYFTPDGGQTWHRVLNARGKLFGFALSPDERWVLAGYGDPVVAATFVEPDELGLYRVALDDLVAAPDAAPWERIYDRSVTCLRWTEHGLFACVSQDQNGFEVGRAPDASFSLADAAPFAALLRLPEVRPLQCPATSGGAACLLAEADGWPATCGVLRAQCSLEGANGEPEPSDPGASGAAGASQVDPSSPPADSMSSPGAGGSDSAASDAAGAGAVSDGTSTGAPGSEAPSRRGSGCSAMDRGGKHSVGSVWWLVALSLTVARRRRNFLRHGAAPFVFLSLLASGLSGCGDDPEPAPQSSSVSDDLERGPIEAVDARCVEDGEDFAPGMSKSTPSRTLTVVIEAAEPAPPLVGSNSWIVSLSDQSGASIEGADVTVTGWMPEHRHGLNALPLTRELDEGRYEVEPIILYMPQLWELGVVVTRKEAREVVTFTFCVP